MNWVENTNVQVPETRIRWIAAISLFAAILNDVTPLYETATSDGTAVN